MPSDMREAVARKEAARKMGLVNDPHGERLPDDLWRQCMPIADAALAVIRERLAEKVPRQPEKPGIRCDYHVAWNDCHEAMLRELGGEG